MRRTKQEALNKISKLSEEVVGKCRICDGNGFFANENMCSCMQAFREKSLAILARIPDEYLEYDLKSYPGVPMTADEKKRADKIVGFVDNYVKGIKPETAQGILFSGSYGQGKSFLSSYCMRKMMWALYPKYLNNTYCTANELVIAYNQHNKHEARRPIFQIEDFYDGVLCIDDLGKEYMMTWKSAVDTDKKPIGLLLDELFRSRMARKLVTFCTTNFTGTDKKTVWEELADHYGASVAETMKLHMRLVKFSDDFPNWREAVSNKANKEFLEEYRV